MAKCTSTRVSFDHVIIWTQIHSMHALDNTTETRKHDRHLQCAMTVVSGATWQSLSTFRSGRFSQLLSGLRWLHCFEVGWWWWGGRLCFLRLKIEMLNFISQIWSDPQHQEYNRRWLSICCNPADLIRTDIFSYKLKIWKLLSLVR